VGKEPELVFEVEWVEPTTYNWADLHTLLGTWNQSLEGGLDFLIHQGCRGGEASGG